MINNHLVYISIMLSGVLLIILTYFPTLDIIFSKLFYDEAQGFIYSNNSYVRFFYHFIPPSTVAFLSICTILLILQYLRRKALSWLIYLLLAVCIGPGIITNVILKSNMGRARPSQITEFGGKKDFTGIMLISNQCKNNCSFPSGHSAMAYFYSSLAYISSFLYRDKKNKYFTKLYLAGLAFGSLTGLSRILMGGHFLSDVIASCFIILTINHLLYLLWKK